MTPKDKAESIFQKYRAFTWGTSPRAKRCAAIVVDEIIEADKDVRWDDAKAWDENMKFWLAVKEELQKL